MEPHTIAAYLRVTSIAISIYDYLETSPTAFRFYREHWAERRLTVSVVLFFLIRFTSITVLTLSSVGFFYNGFTLPLCAQYFLLAPSFKVLQAMVSQAILGIRAFNLSRRSRGAGYFLLVAYAVAVTFQWITSIHQRKPIVHPVFHNCRAESIDQALGAWVYYAVAVVYDLITTAVSIIFLLRYKLSKTHSSMMSNITNMMLYDGLGYFVALTATNILNLVLYRSASEIQTAGASLAYCASWIMSQRLLIHLYGASREKHNESMDPITITQQLESARDVSRAIRTQFENKGRNMTPDLEEGRDSPDGYNIEVRVERTVRLGHRPRVQNYELENYSKAGRRSRDILDTHSRVAALL